MEAKDHASMSDGVDGLESESEVLGCKESESSGYSRNSSELIDLPIELPLRYDSLWVVGQVCSSFGGGA